MLLFFNLPLRVGSEQGSHSRPEAEAVWGAVDHDLTERGHNNQDEDGHDLHEESEASLQKKTFQCVENVNPANHVSNIQLQMTQCLPLLFNNTITLFAHQQVAGALVMTYISLSLPPLSPLITHSSIGVHISVT